MKGQVDGANPVCGVSQRVPPGCLLREDQEPALEVVAQAGSVAEGRQRMAEGGIDAAIVDIPLPDEGAPEMVRDLHEANPPIPVLVMTPIEDPAIHEQMRRAGAAEVLPKDVTFREIIAAVRRLGHEG